MQLEQYVTRHLDQQHGFGLYSREGEESRPFAVIYQLFQAGLIAQIVQYCAQSSDKHLQEFSDVITSWNKNFNSMTQSNVD